MKWLPIATTAMLPVAGHAQDRVIYSDLPEVRSAQDRVGWADAVVSGDTVYVSGVITYTMPGDRSLEDAYERTFKELTNILTRAGVGWRDVVEVRSYHTDPAAQIDAMAAVKRRYRPAPDPAWTAVGTSALLARTGITEIALTARLPKAKP